MSMTLTTDDMTVTLERAAVQTGDVLEVGGADDSATVLVLLATEEAVVLDPCNGDTPFVVRLDEIGEFRRFDVDEALAV